jgi:hypothetical protein
MSRDASRGTHWVYFFMDSVCLRVCVCVCVCVCVSSIDMYNNDVGQESAQKFMKQTGDLKAATLYFAS